MSFRRNSKIVPWNAFPPDFVATFTKADLSRAMAVARENGMTVEVLPDGTLRIIPVGSEKVTYQGEIRL